MRHLLPLLMLLPAAAQEDDDEIPLGIEALTGYRSEYVFRGFSLADSLIELQLEAGIALGDTWRLNLGGFYATGTGSDDFQEAAAYADLAYDTETWTAGIRATGRSYQHPVFEDGIDLGPFFRWFPNDDWRLGGAFSYDSGAQGWYGQVDAKWSKPLDEDSFVALVGGLSATSDYYGRSGFNDLFARASYTYLINRSVAVTPFLGTSVALAPEGSNRLFGGLWFEVNF